MIGARDFIMTWLDPVGVVIGLIIAVPVFWTWWEVTLGRRRRHRRWHRELRERPGARPAILIVDLLAGKDACESVERYRHTVPALAEIPAERVFTISRNNRLTPDAMPELHRELREAARAILLSGTDTLHYFHAGPACAAALVGAEFSNACRVLIYQWDQGSYDNFGPIRSL